MRHPASLPDLSPVGAGVARSLDMGKVIGSNPILGIFEKPPERVAFLYNKKQKADSLAHLKGMKPTRKFFLLLIYFLSGIYLVVAGGWWLIQKTVDPSTLAKINEKFFWRSSLPKAQGTPLLVLVLDDAGHDLNDLRAFLKLPFPFTVATIPTAPVAKEAAALIRQAGKDLFLHQPMQAIGAAPREPHTLLENMTPGDIRARISANLAILGPVTGMNNHQGSLFTQSTERMETILRLCKERDLLFLDSHTALKPVTVSVGTRLNFPVWQNDLFLDNDLDFHSLLQQLIKAMSRANHQGHAVLIGHITHRKELYPFLKKVYPAIQKRGFRFVLLDQIPPANADELPDKKQK